MDKKINYDFNCLTPSDCELTLQTKTDNRMLKTIFAKSKAQMLRKKGVKVEGNLDTIKQFDIPPQFYPYLKIVLKKIVNKIANEVKRDRIELLNYNVKSAKFKRYNDVWDIIIVFGGIYADKR